jgi:hypothetical protein
VCDRLFVVLGFDGIVCEHLADLERELIDAGVVITRPLEASPYGLNDFVMADVDGNTILLGEPFPVSLDGLPPRSDI